MENNIEYNNEEFTAIDISPRTNTSSFFIENDIDIQEIYIRSNSPLTISENNSDDEELHEIRTERLQNQLINYNENIKSSNVIGYKKKHLHDIEKSLTKYYEYDNKYSSKLDILITYTKGQKNIFIQSNYLTHKKFVYLMIPAIIFSATVAILAPSIQEYHWSGGFICALNIIVTSILSILNYTKYELHAEKYLQLANQYDKIEFSLEMTNSKLVFINSEEEKNKIVLDKLKEIEARLNELKELYNIIIPEVIIHLFPIICSINIFSLIKKMELHKQDLIHKFKDIKNEIQYILYKWSTHDSNSTEQQKDKHRLLFLYDIKEKIKIELNQCKHIYDFIDRVFTKEINDAEKIKQSRYLFWGIKKKTAIDKTDMHPLLEKYFNYIFDN
jgi:hypothetical protein